MSIVVWEIDLCGGKSADITRRSVLVGLAPRAACAEGHHDVNPHKRD